MSQIGELVSDGRFGSLDEFLEIAVRNQLLLERTADKGLVATQAQANGEERRQPNARNLLPRSVVPEHLPEVLAGQVRAGPLFGQYYRFLPLKFVLRAIAKGSREALPGLADVVSGFGADALRFGDVLRSRQGKDSLNVATGFPNQERDTAKSTARFGYQYLGRRRSDGSFEGFAFDVGFLGARSEGKSTLVGLTEAGHEFALMENPILDGTGEQPLSVDEVRFLWSWLRQQLPDEHAHLRMILRSIDGGADSPTSLASTLREFYCGSFSAEQWSPAKVNLTRSGGVSRLLEMQLIRTGKNGPRVTYLVNQELLNDLTSNERGGPQ